MLQPNALTLYYLIWKSDQEQQKDIAAQDRSTDVMNTVGDIIFFVLNITSPCLNITSLNEDGSQFICVAIMQRAFYLSLPGYVK